MLGEALRALADATGIRDCELPASALGFADRAAKRPRPRRAVRSEDPSRDVPVPLRAAHGDRVEVGGPPPSPSDPPTRTPGCLRYELGGCAGPCVSAPTSAAYAERVTEAHAFLAGRSRRPIETLRQAMMAAAEAWHFERAGSLKAKVEALEWLASRLARFHAGADRLSFVHRMRGDGGSERLYLIRRGTVRAELPAPTTPDEERELARLMSRVYDGPDPTGADIPTHDLEEFYLVASWFRKHPPGETA
jgi:excinuclease ABC subunit C